MTLRKKVLILYAGIGILILILVGGILWSKLRGDRFDLIASDVERQLTYLDFTLSNFMTEVESDVRALSENELVRSRDDGEFTSFLDANEETFKYNIGDIERGIIDVLNAYRISHSYVNSVYMGRENGSFVRSHPRSIPTQYDPRERPWYTLAAENPGEVVRTESYQSVTTSDVNIGVVTALLDESGQVYGVVGADITLANLTDYISDFDVGHGGQLLLTDEAGSILASRDENLLFSNLRTVYGDKIADSMGESEDVIKIRDTYYFVHNSPDLSWKILALIPSSVINRQILSSVLSPLLGLVFALALLSVLTLVGLDLFVIKPIKNLSETTQHIAKTGDLKHKIDTGLDGEIGSLASSFSHMIEGIRKKESDLVESELKFRNLYNSSRDAIVLSTAEGFIDCNQATLDMFGFMAKSDFTQLHMADVSPPSQPDGQGSWQLSDAYINKAYIGDGIHFDWEFQRQDGTKFPAEVLLGPTEMYGALVIQGVIRDITNRVRAQKKLAHEHAFLRSLLDSVPDVIYVKDRQGVYLNCNRAYEVFGWHKKELVGKTDYDLYPEEIAEKYRQDDEEVIELGNAIKGEDWKEFPDGRRILFETVKTPYRGPDGEVIGVIGISRDITAHNQIEAEVRALNVELEERVKLRTTELTKFSLAIEHSPASVVITDHDRNIEYINPKFSEMTGYQFDEIVGKNFEILQSDEHPDDFYQDLWGTITSGDVWSGEICNRKKNGELYWDLGSISPIFSDQGEITHFVSIREDITDRKRMESELVLAKEKAEDATHAKGEFLANMSHEIRTPMNAVLGMTHLALQTELSTRQEDYLGKIQSSAHSLLGIINDILDFSKIEAGKLDIESVPFNLNEVLDNLATLINVKAQDKNFEIIFSTDPDVPTALVGDPLRLEQVLVNLGSNAVKFTEEGEIVFSTKKISEQDGQITLQFSVRDTGVGLTAEQQSRLFHAFSQADTSITRKYGGTGLGLVISKQLVEMLGGEIWVESEPGVGSEFIFTVVFERSSERISGRSIIADAELHTLRVLVVDDNPTARETLLNYLETIFLFVDATESGESCLKELEESADENPFSLVFIDWEMPGLDGLEVARQIKDSPERYATPSIVMITAFGREDVLVQAEDIGIEGFLVKPISQSTLFDVIMQLLRKDIPEETIAKKAVKWNPEDTEILKGANILLVEDIEINQEIVAGLLAPTGIEIDVASSGEEALQKIFEKEYNAVLMDVQMPGMDGYQATKAIRENDSFNDLPVIAMTAHAMAGDREKSLQAGMCDHITKPINPGELIAALIKWVGTRRRDTAEKQADEHEHPFRGLKGIKTDSGLNRVNGNHELYCEILYKFYSDFSDVTTRITEALETNEKEAARHLVHAIKGVAGNVGAEELHAAADQLEKSIIDDGNEISVDDFNQAFMVVHNSLGEFLAKSESDSNLNNELDDQLAQPDLPKFQILLAELEPHIRKRKPIQSKRVIAEIKKLDGSNSWSGWIAEMESLIKKYKFKQALGILASMQEKTK